MKRIPLLLSLTLAVSVLAVPAHAHERPSTAQGGPTELLRFTGDPASATGSAISNGACDVNGDGVDDAVVGAWGWDKGLDNVGAAYVLLGGPDARGAALADPASAGAVRIDGYEAGSNTATSVACLGDVDADGYDDIGIGDYQNNRAFVIFGAQVFTGVTLDALGDRGFIVKEDFTDDERSNFSTALSAVGDVNGDGLDDFAVAGVVADTRSRTNNGRVWIIAGRDDISDVDVSDPSPGEVLLSVDGALDGERLGAIARAGDVNGDGTDDFVLGSYTSTPWGTSVAATGAAYVVFGGATGGIDLLALGDQGFSIRGPQRQRDRLGMSVSAAGDVDGDGKDDLLIGADGVSNATTGDRNGGAAVVLGSSATRTVHTDPAAAHGQSVFTCPEDEPAGSCSTPTRRGYWINGATKNDAAGYSVAGIGDVNADDVPDFAIGAYGFDPVDPADATATMSGAGATYVVYGKPAGMLQELSALTAADGFRIDGQKAADRFGRQVGVMGDFDGNGVRDLAVGADQVSQQGSTRNGVLTIALMGQLATSTTVSGPSSVAPTRPVAYTASVTKLAGSRTALSEGTVSFSVAGAQISRCAALPVVAGQATCATTIERELAGDVVATFSGSAVLKASHARTAVTAVKAPSRVGVSRSRGTLKGRQRLTVRVAVTAKGVGAVGKVHVKVGSKTVKTVKLKHGKVRYTLPRFTSRGTKKISVVYLGSGSTARSTKTVKVVQK